MAWTSREIKVESFSLEAIQFIKKLIRDRSINGLRLDGQPDRVAIALHQEANAFLDETYFPYMGMLEFTIKKGLIHIEFIEPG